MYNVLGVMQGQAGPVFFVGFFTKVLNLWD
jgi:hypothetical protein